MAPHDDEEESLFVGNSDADSDHEMRDAPPIKIKSEPDLNIISSSSSSEEPQLKTNEEAAEMARDVSMMLDDEDENTPSGASTNTTAAADTDVNADTDPDEIVQEFPVYFSTGLLHKLYLLQYPTRSAARPLVDANRTGVLDSRLKPVSQVVEIDVPLETKKFYDTEKGEHWNKLNKQTFSGVARPALDGEYMIGVFKDNELHLNMVTAVAQLRPQFQHITHRNLAEAEKESKESADKETAKKQPRAVQMMAMGSGENAPNFSGAISARKHMEDEDFVGMDWYDRDSDESWSISDKLIATTKTPLVSTTTLEEYVQEISAPYIDPTLKSVQ